MSRERSTVGGAGQRLYPSASKADGTLRRELEPDTTADWLVRVAQMLLIENLTEGAVESKPDRRALLRDFVITGILSPTTPR